MGYRYGGAARVFSGEPRVVCAARLGYCGMGNRYGGAARVFSGQPRVRCAARWCVAGWATGYAGGGNFQQRAGLGGRCFFWGVTGEREPGPIGGVDHRMRMNREQRARLFALYQDVCVLCKGAQPARTERLPGPDEQAERMLGEIRSLLHIDRADVFVRMIRKIRQRCSREQREAEIVWLAERMELFCQRPAIVRKMWFHMDASIYI